MKPRKVESLEQISDFSCGPCAVQSVLRAFGEFRSQEALAEQLGTTEKRGTPIDEIKRFFWYKGFSTEERAGVGWRELLHLRKQTKNPLLVCWTPTEEPESHYSLLKEVKKDRVVLTNTYDGSNLEVDRIEWMHRWRDGPDISKKEQDIHWVMEVKK